MRSTRVSIGCEMPGRTNLRDEPIAGHDAGDGSPTERGEGEARQCILAQVVMMARRETEAHLGNPSEALSAT